MHDATSPAIRTKKLVFVILLSVAICFFLILFIITNSQWTPVYIPSLPWRSNAVWFAFETPFIVAVGLAMTTGSAITILVSRILYKRTSQKQMVLKNYINKLENEVEKTQRLIASTHATNNIQAKPSSDLTPGE